MKYNNKDKTQNIVKQKGGGKSMKQEKENDDNESTSLLQYEGGSDKGSDKGGSKKAKTERSQAAPDEYQENRKFCFCCSLKCGIITFGVLILADLCLELFELWTLFVNDYFDKYYAVVYMIILLGLVAACVLQFRYWCSKDSPSARAVVPWSFLIAGITNFLLFIWIMVYVCAIYKNDKVWVPRYERDEDADTDAGESGTKITYTKQSKASYIFMHVLAPLINGTAFLLFWWTSKEWVDRHANQQRAYG